jgi:hypothetical protein
MLEIKFGESNFKGNFNKWAWSMAGPFMVEDTYG